MNFNTYSFKELLTDIVDNRGKTCPVEESGMPLIATNCIKENTLYPVFEKVRYVSDDTYKTWFRGHPKSGDMIFVCKGSPGRVNWVPDPVSFCIAQDMVSIRADETKVYPKYLFALLRSKVTQQKILNMHVGTLIPHFKKGDFGNLYFDIPDDMDYQKKVGDAYFDFCLKIEANAQLNQTLEEMVQAIFKSWFVDFDPVKAKINGEQPEGMDEATASLFPEKLVESEIGLIPEGWVETPLYDIAEYINGAAYKKFEPNNEGIGLPIVKIAELKAGITQKTGFSTVDMPAKYRLEDNDILFSWSGNPDTSIDTFVWALGEAWLNQHIFKVVPKSVLSRDYVLCLLKFMRPVFAEIARDKQTTGLGHVTVKDLKRLTVAVPSEELLTKFNEKVSALIAQNFSLVKQNQNLEKLRDTLLPKLLSGEIELETTEELVEVN